MRKTIRVSVCAMALGLCAIARAADHATTSTTSPAGPRIAVAQRVLAIRGNVNLDETSVNRGFLEAARDTFHMPLEEAAREISFNLSNSLQQFPSVVTSKLMTLRVEVDPDAPPDHPDAKTIADALAAHADAVVHAAQFRAVDEAEQAFSRAVHQRNEVRDQLNALRQSLAGQQIAAGTPQELRNEAQRLAGQVQQLEVDDAGLKARADALARESDRLTKGGTEHADSDPVAKELQQIAELREAQLAQVKASYRAGAAPESEVRTAEAAAAEARAHLLERRDAAAKSVGADVLADLNRDLFKATADLAETEARLKVLHDRLDRLHDAAAMADRWDDLLAQAASTSAAVAEATKNQLETERGKSDYEVPVTTALVESKDTPAAPATTQSQTPRFDSGTANGGGNVPVAPAK